MFHLALKCDLLTSEILMSSVFHFSIVEIYFSWLSLGKTKLFEIKVTHLAYNVYLRCKDCSYDYEQMSSNFSMHSALFG
jgi:hypothetical protein